MTMQTEEVALSRIAENANNPRTITEEKFKKLVKSLLVFPRMLTLRPIVVDETMTVLGGNMRLKALKHCVTMDEDSIRDILKEDGRYTKGEISNLMKYWIDWRKKPVATIVNASDLTEAQKKEFIIKDNVGFGDWDTSVLANEWDTLPLDDWGIDTSYFGTSSSADIDGLFAEVDNLKPKTNDVSFSVCIPEHMKDKEEEIKEIVKSAISEYEGVHIK